MDHSLLNVVQLQEVVLPLLAAVEADLMAEQVVLAPHMALVLLTVVMQDIYVITVEVVVVEGADGVDEVYEVEEVVVAEDMGDLHHNHLKW
jgi:hypothetical protein